MTLASSPNNLVWQPALVDRDDRTQRNGHPGVVVWLTGLPASGKSTLASQVEARLHRMGLHTALLDGDNIRHGLCADLGFSVEDRAENIRRVGEVAKLFAAQGCVVFVALVSPMRDARNAARQRLPDGDFIEVHCHCPVAVCQARDPKGMYARALAGEIADFTGVSAPYEAPLKPELRIDTAANDVEVSAEQLARYLLDRLQFKVQGA